MNKAIFTLLVFLFLPWPALAQIPTGGIAIHGRGQQASGDAVSVRCRNTADTAFEACGGGAGGGGGDGKILDGTAAGEADVIGSNPAGTEQGVVVRNIPSGTQDVNCASGCAGGTQYDQGTASTATDKVTAAGAIRRDTAALDAGVADGDRAALSVDSAGRLRVTAVDTTQPISVSSLPLPTGAATSANQSTANTSLASIDGKLPASPAQEHSFDADSGAGVQNVQGVSLRKSASGGSVEYGTTTDPLRIDPTGTTTQPVSGTVTANIGTFPDNEPINISQINGVTPLMGAGNTGTGSPRVTIASDNAAIQIKGQNSTSPIYCTNNAFLNMTTATTTEIVALSGSTIIYVCSFSIVSNGATATNVKFVDGTGTNCATSQSDRSGNIPLTAATNTVGISRGSGEGMILKTSTAGDALCVTSSGAATIAVDVSYAQY